MTDIRKPVHGAPVLKLITGKVLMLVCPTLDEKRANFLAQLMNEECPQFGITTPDILQEFVARCAVESGEFAKKEESLYYKAERLIIVWPSRFKSLESATNYARQPEKLANFVYGNRADLGNNKPGDGWKFRGGCFIQCTGRLMYEKAGQMLGCTAEEAAELMRTDDRVAMRVSAWIFGVVKKLIDEAIADDITSVVVQINGGRNGLEETKKYQQRAVKYIV